MEQKEKQKADFFLKSIYKKAWKDKKFLKNLVKNPIKTLNHFTGKEGMVPSDKVLIVEDQTNPNHIYLNIPVKPTHYEEELSDQQLDKVTGALGRVTTTFWNELFQSVKTELKNLFEKP